MTVKPPIQGFAEAARAVTAAGQRFELVTVSVRGQSYPAFKAAPPTLGQLFSAARQHQDQTFVVYESERWTFGQVLGQADALGAALIRRYGVRHGDRVAIAMRNYPEWIVAFAAITSIGAVSVSLNAWGTEPELDFALVDSGARLLIADGPRIRRTAQTRRRLGIRAVAVRSPAGPGEGVDNWADVLATAAGPQPADVRPDDDATILYTSGTTGRPKGAVSTHRSIVQALFGFACRTAIDVQRRPEVAVPAGQRVMILVVPLFHVTGCVPIMLSCFITGSKLVMMHRWDPEKALELIERERVTTLLGVPAQSWDMLDSVAVKEHDLSSLRLIGGGGAPAPPVLVRRLAEQFPAAGPAIGYGLTETNGYGTANTGADYVEHPASAGRPAPILELDIRNEQEQSVPTGQSGEIWMRGVHVFRGYWRQPDATASSLVNGWFRTGDIGHLDEEGFLYIEDRLKDVILRGGENIYCAEVEAVLHEHDGIRDVAVFGLADARLGEEVAAAVVLKAGSAVSAEDLADFTAGRLAPFKVPSRWFIVAGQLPRSAVGKVLKRELQKRFSSAPDGDQAARHVRS